MTKVTWLGDGSDAQENEWNGVVFPRGEPVDLDKAVRVADQREHMLAKAKYNRFYQVSGERKPDVVDPLELDAQPIQGRPDDKPVNMAFASEEELEARAEATRQLSEAHDEFVERSERRRGPGRPRKHPEPAPVA